ncbi:FAD-dependent oxidoreductase [Oscillatoria sp. FACHB-1407]|uniref:phytoene desaturase family protein n=1 Tax=Oscillatoria sp. FACHB-1407 TaxID=2692847 RepID=UPI001683D8A6|nr:NAD(P)/FAD-dependent oxidoreductase [Oscillatoria sp. FACHB-1407]MBD2465409.1 FAD-dependent oxidoreductase [Oscillatoria sp. FACHB-1407]
MTPQKKARNTDLALQTASGRDADAIVIGSGIGGLVTAALLARYGWTVIVCESHVIAGGAAHSFVRQGFHFDSGPSFYCGLSDPRSLNPLCQVLQELGESLSAVAYDPLGHYHFPEGTFAVYGNADRYREAIAQITPTGAQEFARFERRLMQLYEALRGIPTIALRADLSVIPTLLSRYSLELLKLLPQLSVIQSSVGTVMDQYVSDRWVRRLIDLECFLLSGLKAYGTIAPEVAFMMGERSHSTIDYPVGGSGAIVEALVRGLQRWGGQLRLNTHVDQILVEQGQVTGVRLRKGETLRASVVISNATIWDTYTHLLQPQDLPTDYRQMALQTPAIASFMHLHLGIRADGLEHLTGHHVVVHDATQDITVPGNTCMISIPSVWDASLAPPGHHVVHAYTLEPAEGWQRDDSYESRKRDRAQALYRALERVIPDIRSRITLELIGTPLTHAHYLRRHQGTYGPAIAAGQGMFPSCYTPIQGLYRVGDSTLPGIGVPAVAASGILCANTLKSKYRL